MSASALFLPLRVLTGWEVRGLRFGLEDNLEIFLVLGVLARIALAPRGGLGELVAPLRRLESLALGPLRRRRRELLLGAAATVAALVPIELYARRFPETLPRPLGNELASRYHDLRSGIFLRNDPARMRAMKPDDDKGMYFNGYRWRHRTDARGFRNPETWPAADVVLLGDSMVYGHGVEEEGTVRSHLAGLTGATVANLGVQGAGPHEEYQILRRHGAALGPGQVLCFFLYNDVDDTAAALDDAEIGRFLALAPGDHDTGYLDAGPPPGNWLEPAGRLLRELYVIRAWVYAKKHLRAGAVAVHAAALPGGEVPGWIDLPPFAGRPRRALAMRFVLRSIERMRDLAVRAGAGFALVLVRTGHAPEEEFYERIIERHCTGRGIDHFSLGPALEGAAARGGEPFLPGDGHFSAAGARVVAAALAERFFDTRGLPPDLDRDPPQLEDLGVDGPVSRRTSGGNRFR